jgi:hypothetical protein
MSSRTTSEEKCSRAIPRAASEWEAYSLPTSFTASAASSTVMKPIRPFPVGKRLEKPVSWVTTGRPAARKVALRSLNHPVRSRTFWSLATVNSAIDEEMNFR